MTTEEINLTLNGIIALALIINFFIIKPYLRYSKKLFSKSSLGIAKSIFDPERIQKVIDIEESKNKKLIEIEQLDKAKVIQQYRELNERYFEILNMPVNFFRNTIVKEDLKKEILDSYPLNKEIILDLLKMSQVK